MVIDISLPLVFFTLFSVPPDKGNYDFFLLDSVLSFFICLSVLSMRFREPHCCRHDFRFLRMKAIMISFSWIWFCLFLFTFPCCS